MVGDRLSLPDCSGGALLDGFPRTRSQAEALDALLADAGGVVDLVIYLDVSPPVLMDRLSGRWVCRRCGRVYHTTFRPMRLSGVCDFCRGNLVRLSYDTEETQRRRIQLFFEQTEPVLAHYRAQGVLHELEGEQPVDTINRLLRRRVQQVDADLLAGG
jgi:adenylate kinase